MQVSGGHLLPPVQKLVATLIFARPTQGQKCKSSPVTSTKIAPKFRASEQFFIARLHPHGWY